VFQLFDGNLIGQSLTTTGLNVREPMPFSQEDMERRFFAAQKAWQKLTQRRDLSLGQL
jgi:hypothetical protein